MKTCPICGAQAFDDAKTCYGCLHKFTSSDTPRHAATSQRKATPSLPEIPRTAFVSPPAPDASAQTRIAKPMPSSSSAVLPGSSTSGQSAPTKSLQAQPQIHSFELPLDNQLSMRASCDVIVRFFPIAQEMNTDDRKQP